MDKRTLETKVELRTEEDKTYIEGYGILFNSRSHDLGGFIEVIEPSALEGADLSDVIGRAEHTNSMLLGRSSSGTLKLTIDQRGVKYTIEAPNTTAGRDTVEYIKRGDMRGASFAFSGVTDKWEEQDGGPALRTITAIKKIHDIGPVVNPAYGATTAEAVRSLDEWKENEGKEPEVTEPTSGLDLKIKIERLKN